MKEEINKVLNMVKEGKITSEEGTELIEALNNSKNEMASENAVCEEIITNTSKDKMLKVKIISHDKDKINIQ